jgi:hypothetical protein
MTYQEALDGKAEAEQKFLAAREEMMAWDEMIEALKPSGDQNVIDTAQAKLDAAQSKVDLVMAPKNPV